MDKEISEMLTQIQPLYTKLISNFSSAYLHGSEWYVGDDLNKWWEKQDKIHFDESRRKVEIIIQHVQIYFYPKRKVN